MPKDRDTMPPSSEKTAAAQEQLAGIRSEIAEALGPLREAIAQGDLNAVKKSYRKLIQRFHEDKFAQASAEVVAEVSAVNKKINRLQAILNTESPPDRKLSELAQAADDIEAAISEKPKTDGQDQEISEEELFSEAETIGIELDQIDREGYRTRESLDRARNKLRELQQLVHDWSLLSPEFQAAHLKEVQRVGDSVAELQAKIERLSDDYDEVYYGLAFFRIYQQDKLKLAEAPKIMQEMMRQYGEAQQAIERLTQRANILGQKGEQLARNYQADLYAYQMARTELGRIIQWQQYLDNQLLSIVPYSVPHRQNRLERQQYDLQYRQVSDHLSGLWRNMEITQQRQAENQSEMQACWDEKLYREREMNQLYRQMADMNQETVQRQASLGQQRENLVRTVKARRRARRAPRTGPEANA